MREGRNCHTCQKASSNLMNANCGHKICFNCVKSNKNAHKCSQCSGVARSRAQPLLPSYPSMYSPPCNIAEKERSTKAKETDGKAKESDSKPKQSDRKLYSDTTPCHLRTSRRSLHKSSVNVVFEGDGEVPMHIICKQHQEPLTMFCRSSKELICSMCLCTKYKFGNDILSLKGAEEHLRKLTRLQKEQSKIALSSVESANKVMRKNIDIFESSRDQHIAMLKNLFKGIRDQLDALQQAKTQAVANFFEGKLQQSKEICADLDYLASILREYRDSFRDNSPLNELVYLFTSYKMIRSTLRNLDLEYLAYNRDITLADIHRRPLKDAIDGLIRLKLDLPLRESQKRKTRSSAAKSASRSKQDESPIPSHGANQNSSSKRHQMSLCGNIHGIDVGEDEKNLYKILLKSKFRA